MNLENVKVGDDVVFENRYQKIITPVEKVTNKFLYIRIGAALSKYKKNGDPCPSNYRDRIREVTQKDYEDERKADLLSKIFDRSTEKKAKSMSLEKLEKIWEIINK